MADQRIGTSLGVSLGNLVCKAVSLLSDRSIWTTTSTQMLQRGQRTKNLLTAAHFHYNGGVQLSWSFLL